MTQVSHPHGGRTPVGGALLPAAVLSAVFATTVAVLGMQSSGAIDKQVLVLPIGAVVLALLAWLSAVRFASFVLVVLTLRSSLDYAKLGGGSPVMEPTVVIGGLLIVAGLVWLGVSRASGHSQPLSPLEKGFLGFLAAAVFSVLGSGSVLTSATEWARIASVAVMVLVAVRLFDDDRYRRRAMVAVYASFLVPALVAGYQAASGVGVRYVDEFTRLQATFVHPTSFSLYLMFLLVMGAGLLLTLRGPTRFVLLGVLGVAGVCLIGTYTRGAWLAATVGLLVVAGLHNRKVLLAVVALIVAVAVFVPSVSGRFADLGTSTQASGDAGNSLEWRLRHWNETLALTKGHEVTGIGLKMVQASSTQAAHNDYIRAYAETGVIGLLAYLVLLAAFVRTAWAALRVRTDGFDRGVALGFAGCVCSLLTISLTDNIFSQVVVLWYFAVFAAAATAIIRRARHDVAA